MADKKHYEKWLFQTPVALLLCMSSVMTVFYFMAYHRESINTDNWMMWGLISASLMMAGLGLLANAIVHKVKADLSRRSRRSKTDGAPE